MTVSSTNEPTLRVLDIVAGTSVDGVGLRTSVYLAGCRHHCPGCHNPESWDMTGGKEMTIAEIVETIAREEFPVTLSGGDPLYQPHGVTALAREIKKRLGYDIWLYTGFTLDEIIDNPELSEPLPWIDVIVDGPYRRELRDLSLLFRGSSNQRIIRLHPKIEILNL